MLNTERISLRPITDDDFSLFHRLHNEELVIKYCFDAVSDNEIKTKLNECWKNQIGEPLLSKRIVFVITEAKTGNKIGVTGFFRALDKVEVGYLLLPEFFGQGFATESLKLVIDYAKAKGLSELCATVTKGNDASVGVLTKVGFKLVGEKSNAYEIAGELRDDLYFALCLAG